MTVADDLLEFVDAERHADALAEEVLSDRFAVIHGQEQPRRRGEARMDWFVRRVADRGAKEADRAECLGWNPREESLCAVDEPELPATIESFDEARIVSLGDAPRWGDGSAYEPWQPVTETLSDERYGDYTEHPHVAIDLGYEEWTEVLKELLQYRIGPPIAWAYENGAAYLWGEQLDGETLRTLTDGCHDLEREYSDDRMHELAQTAGRTESKLSRAEIDQPGTDSTEADSNA